MKNDLTHYPALWVFVKDVFQFALFEQKVKSIIPSVSTVLILRNIVDDVNQEPNGFLD